MVFIIGIDPGLSGGIALLGREDGPVAVKMPETERDVWDTIQDFCPVALACIEQVGSMPKQGVSSTFKFGRNYGFLRGCLIGSGMPFEQVTPVKWQRALSCLSGGDKSITRARAQELFPRVLLPSGKPHRRITNAIADALLIAEYARRELARRQ